MLRHARPVVVAVAAAAADGAGAGAAWRLPYLRAAAFVDAVVVAARVFSQLQPLPSPFSCFPLSLASAVGAVAERRREGWHRSTPAPWPLAESLRLGRDLRHWQWPSAALRLHPPQATSPTPVPSLFLDTA